MTNEQYIIEVGEIVAYPRRKQKQFISPSLHAGFTA